MKYTQDTNISIIILGLLFCVLIIYWIRSVDIKEAKRLNEEKLEMDFYTKNQSWRVYILAGTGVIIFAFEILKRLYNLAID
jgi:hypothetical protein